MRFAILCTFAACGGSAAPAPATSPRAVKITPGESVPPTALPEDSTPDEQEPAAADRGYASVSAALVGKGTVSADMFAEDARKRNGALLDCFDSARAPFAEIVLRLTWTAQGIATGGITQADQDGVKVEAGKRYDRVGLERCLVSELATVLLFATTPGTGGPKFPVTLDIAIERGHGTSGGVVGD